MKPDAPEPLAPQILDALRAERTAVFAPADAEARVLQRLGASIVTPPSGGGGGGASEAAGPRVPRAMARPVSLLVSFVLGGAAVLGLQAARGTRPVPPPRIVYVEVPATSAPAASAPPKNESAPPLPSAPSSQRAPAGDELGAERALLDVARTALGRGDGDAALVAAAKHQKRFPTGALAEEREGIAVQALVLEKRFDEARARGARFHQRFPRSVLAPAIDASLASIP